MPSSGRVLKLVSDIRCVLIRLRITGMSIIFLLSNVMRHTLFCHDSPIHLGTD